MSRSRHPADYFGSPPDSDPPPGLDWDLWLGPAPKRPFNLNRFGVNPSQYGILDPNQFPAGAKWSSFRYFWDYAGGDMTDSGTHHIDIIRMCFDKAAPVSAAAIEGKFRLKDNRETPDTPAGGGTEEQQSPVSKPGAGWNAAERVASKLANARSAAGE
ncbi:MAG: hypothetical protein LC126_25525 [Bryobacterales bacterium]|nr:hypothetical protein [Bryobacterales bacterium]